ncbi:MAG: hypothetical protein IPK59_14405 [Rhodospirillaceae bacterium]|nr:hypothetical protein [Rhodospirillaceae bacterium]
MARNPGIETEKSRSEALHVQAAFDFLPQEMRHRMRFKDVLQAGRADLRNHSRLIDRQVVGIGSRIAAARLREILRPADEVAAGWAQSAPGMNMPEGAAAETKSLEMDAMTTDTGLISQARSNTVALAQQREILREIGTAVFYFRDEDETPSTSIGMQRLHPRPLPARYYGAPPQQAGAAVTLARDSGDRVSAPSRRIA